jgi:hypothetical protein
VARSPVTKMLDGKSTARRLRTVQI